MCARRWRLGGHVESARSDSRVAFAAAAAVAAAATAGVLGAPGNVLIRARERRRPGRYTRFSPAAPSRARLAIVCSNALRDHPHPPPATTRSILFNFAHSYILHTLREARSHSRALLYFHVRFHSSIVSYLLAHRRHRHILGICVWRRPFLSHLLH